MRVNAHDFLATQGMPRRGFERGQTLAGLGFVGDFGLGAKAKKKQQEHAAGQTVVAGKTVKDKVTKAETDEWNRYIALLRDLVSALRSGQTPPTTPNPPAPTFGGTKAQAKTANDLLTVSIPSARATASYLQSLKPSTPTPTTPPPSASDMHDQEQVSPPPGGTTINISNSTPTDTVPSQPAGTAPEYTGGPSGGTTSPGTVLPSGTIIDSSTGQPIQNSLLSNKYVWIGLAAAVGFWWLKKRKR